VPRLATGYERFLLFRDNVQHHLQAGHPVPAYDLIHAVADAPLEHAVVCLKASALWEQSWQAYRELCELPIADLAMSIRTKAILTGTPVLPAIRGTALLRLTGWKVPIATQGARTLGELFQALLSRVALITRSSSKDGQIELLLRLHQPSASQEHAMATWRVATTPERVDLIALL
jgi:hypothetical protein